MTRFCGGCNADVEVSQGACLLGHPVGHIAPTGSITELRHEVDKVFADAAATVTEVLTASDIARSAGLDTENPAPFVPAAPPPPPPSGSTEGRRAHDVYSGISTSGRKEDPIEAFAPPPRMDWGPERFKLGRRRRAAAI